MVFDVRASLNFSWQRETGSQMSMRWPLYQESFWDKGKKDSLHIGPGDTYRYTRQLRLQKSRRVQLKSDIVNLNGKIHLWHHAAMGRAKKFSLLAACLVPMFI